MPSTRDWRSRGYMTIIREHPKGSVILLVHRKKGLTRWSPMNQGDWMKYTQFETFNEVDEGDLTGVITGKEIMWLRDNCKCAETTCGPCSKKRVGVPDFNT